MINIKIIVNIILKIKKYLKKRSKFIFGILFSIGFTIFVIIVYKSFTRVYPESTDFKNFIGAILYVIGIIVYLICPMLLLPWGIYMIDKHYGSNDDHQLRKDDNAQNTRK